MFSCIILHIRVSSCNILNYLQPSAIKLDKEGEGRSLFLKEGEDPVPGGSPLSPIINIPFSTRSLADGRTTD